LRASGRVGKWQHELACEWRVWWDGAWLTGTRSEWASGLASGLESGWTRACTAESECSGQATINVAANTFVTKRAALYINTTNCKACFNFSIVFCDDTKVWTSNLTGRSERGDDLAIPLYKTSYRFYLHLQSKSRVLQIPSANSARLPLNRQFLRHTDAPLRDQCACFIKRRDVLTATINSNVFRLAPSHQNGLLTTLQGNRSK
jgi:hypothetical protein